MPVYIVMPSLSDTMTEGTLLKWHIRPGDQVAAGQVIADIQTDKATMEQTTFDAGTVHKLYVAEGEKVPLGGAMAMILSEGEAPPTDESPPAPAKSAAPAEAAAGGSVRTTIARAAMGVGASRSRGGRVKASPLARKIASERGLNLSALTGTGPGGRIVRADVLAAGSNGGGRSGFGLPAIRPSAGPDDVRTPLTPMRTLIAQRLLASKTQIPHFYLHIEIDAGPLMTFRAQANAAEESRGTGNKFSVNDFILKAAAAAAVQVPAANAAFDVDAIVRFASVNLNVAIAVDDGLVTPVIRDAQHKSLSEISAAVRDFAKRAKQNQLKLDELVGGTLTISNLGAYGIDSFDAIINPPQAAILSIGAIVKKPVVDASGQLAVGERMWIGMSCDHRVIDGAVGATYLAALRKLLESPAMMLV